MTEKERRAMRAECDTRARMSFIPHEFKGQFVTSDREVYQRKPSGQIVHAGPPKSKGKAARREDKRRRQALRAQRKRDEQLAAIAKQVCECQTVNGSHADTCPVTIAENFKRRTEAQV